MKSLVFTCRWSACLLMAAGLATFVPSLFAEQKRTDTAAASQREGADKKVATIHRLDAEGDSFGFETEQIQGSIRLDGAYHGVTRLMDKRTGRQVIDPRYSALNLYRLMAVNQVLGMPRTMPRTIRTGPHWVEAQWIAEAPQDEVAARQQVGDIRARYEVHPPNAIDVTVTVRSQGTFSGFEVFLPSYFDKVLKPHVYLQPLPVARGGTTAEPDRVLPTVNDVFRGTLLVFPRDAHAARYCVDGRWNLREIQTVPARYYGYCLAALADPQDQLAVVLMSRPRHCFAISARYHAQNDADRLTSYSAVDFSLFGDDLLPGDERSVQVRLAVVPLDSDGSQPAESYKAFLAEMDGQLRSPHEPTRKGEVP